MIVDPDFFDHWRTRMLVNALGGDEMAPLYVQRLWAHCQLRKGTVFAMPAEGLKALTKFAGDAATLERALTDAGFLARREADVEVLKWAEYNSQLIAAWTNGKAGGRPKSPKRQPTENPQDTGRKPAADLTATQEKAIREDKRREEEYQPPDGGCSSESVDSAHPAEAAGKRSKAATLQATPDCPHQRILALWAEMLPELPQHNAKRWDGARADALRARWNETAAEKAWANQEDGLRYFCRLFAYIRQSDFLMGRKDPAPGRKRMEATLEWATTRSKWDRIIEGLYHDPNTVEDNDEHVGERAVA
ncbi:MAG: hypothetical protein ACTHL8_01050 [Burkholderiaceae bacterium]